MVNTVADAIENAHTHIGLRGARLVRWSTGSHVVNMDDSFPNLPFIQEYL
jgi:hypothetical protein